MKLVIVESPTKIKTIKKYLGADYKIMASRGHVRDLPKSSLGVDEDLNIKYLIPAKARKTVKELKAESKKADDVILATDPDREGEAIAWHIQHILDRPCQRALFQEITKEAIQKSIENLGQVRENLVNAQQARRVLDRIVGYSLSPLLWKKVARGLSAGRVQSVAVRLIVEREREREAFKPEEFWKITAKLKKDTEFTAELKNQPKTQEEAEKVLKELGPFIVDSVISKEKKRSPVAPFTTSTLQQEGSRRLHLSSSMTMRLAQKLYEEGYITYHRTDSRRLSSEAMQSTKAEIIKRYGEEYYRSCQYQSGKQAQEAHEAIRPVNYSRHPKDEKLAKLYKLIVQRTLASQMMPARFQQTRVEILSNNHLFIASGQTLLFAGFLKEYPLKTEESILPVLKKDDLLEKISVTPSQHFTKPPARYNEASLIKLLEEKGIGRPSTYAPTIETCLKRGYIQKDENRSFFPTDIAGVVIDLLVKHFSEVVDIDFTANMEKQLDNIAEAKEEWKEVVQSFTVPFLKKITEKDKEIEKKVTKTGEKCPECGKDIIIKYGRFGQFLACSGFPDCRYSRPLEETKETCPACGAPMEKRVGKFGPFLSCSRYPDCLGLKKVGTCPECGGDLVEKRSRRGTFIGCSNYPKCKFIQGKKNAKKTKSQSE
jgi:DNA topoisomerase I